MITNLREAWMTEEFYSRIIKAFEFKLAWKLFQKIAIVEGPEACDPKLASVFGGRLNF